MKVHCKNKILISGLFPMENFKIDGYEQKRCKYDETMIKTDSEDYIFYASGYLIQSSYNPVEEDGIFYEYFENIEPIEIEIESEINQKEKIEEEVLKKMIFKISLLEKKLRLITNLQISLPVFKTNIYDENNNHITYVGFTVGQASSLAISSYTDEMKKILVNRLKFNIADQTLIDVENKNIRYRRALTFFNNSFVPNDISVRFALLFSTLESLFNINGEEVSETVSKYCSKILYLSSKEEKRKKMKIKDYYDIRSKYIHGNEPRPITEKNEFDLREIVREVLLIYWNLSVSMNIYDAEEMMKYLDKTDQNTLHLLNQLFIKSLHITNYDSFYNFVKSKLEKNEMNILSDNNL